MKTREHHVVANPYLRCRWQRVPSLSALVINTDRQYVTCQLYLGGISRNEARVLWYC